MFRLIEPCLLAGHTSVGSKFARPFLMALLPTSSARHSEVGACAFSGGMPEPVAPLATFDNRSRSDPAHNPTDGVSGHLVFYGYWNLGSGNLAI